MLDDRGKDEWGSCKSREAKDGRHPSEGWGSNEGPPTGFRGNVACGHLNFRSQVAKCEKISVVLSVPPNKSDIAVTCWGWDSLTLERAPEKPCHHSPPRIPLDAEIILTCGLGSLARPDPTSHSSAPAHRPGGSPNTLAFSLHNTKYADAELAVYISGYTLDDEFLEGRT